MTHPLMLFFDMIKQGEHKEGDLQVMLDDHIHSPSFLRNIKSSPFRPVRFPFPFYWNPLRPLIL